jgi:RNA polymerase sigma-70 factor (ECF subfamily)
MPLVGLMSAGPAPSDDRALVERIAVGDELAFATAYDRHANLLFGSLVRFLGDREAAAEVTQDAFMALWRRAAQFDAAAGSLSSWLLGIARNRAIDRFRAEGRRPTGHSIPLSILAADEHEERSGHGSDDLPMWRVSDADELGVVPPDPGTEADRHWLQAVVRTVVSELPEAERSVVLLAYSAGLSQSQIADHVGAPIGTVKSRTRRAFARLRTSLGNVPGLLDEDLGLAGLPVRRGDEG